MDLINQVAAAWQEAEKRIGRDPVRKPVIVGVSGGPDSLALINVLSQLLPPTQLIIAHLDHQLRPSSAEEAQFVARIAADLGVPCHIKQESVHLFARNSGLTLEEAGRIARYRFLADAARTVGAAIVAVGHNADDQTETILMHFLRGSGPNGLRGMATLAPMPNAPDLWLWRPLLGAGRGAIEEFCREHNLSPRIDLTNADTTYHRNRLRHQLLPILETYNPQIRQRLNDMADVIAAEDELLSRLTEESWQAIHLPQEGDGVRLDRTAWLAQPLAIRRRLLRRAMKELFPDLRNVSFRAIESARQIAEAGRTGAQATLPGGINLRIDYHRVVMSAGNLDPPTNFLQLPEDGVLSLDVPGRVLLANGWQLTAELIPVSERDGIFHNHDPWQCFVTPNVNQQLIVRARTPGEKIRPLGLAGEKKIKDVMIDRKIPAAARRNWPIVASQSHALWIVGHVVDDRGRVTSEHQHVLHLRCVRGDVEPY